MRIVLAPPMDLLVNGVASSHSGVTCCTMQGFWPARYCRPNSASVKQTICRLRRTLGSWNLQACLCAYTDHFRAFRNPNREYPPHSLRQRIAQRKHRGAASHRLPALGMLWVLHSMPGKGAMQSEHCTCNHCSGVSPHLHLTTPAFALKHHESYWLRKHIAKELFLDGAQGVI